MKNDLFGTTDQLNYQEPRKTHNSEYVEHRAMNRKVKRNTELDGMKFLRSVAVFAHVGFNRTRKIPNQSNLCNLIQETEKQHN